MPVTAVAFDLDYTLAVPDRDRQTLLDEATEAVGAPRISRESYLDAHRRHLTNETREAIFADLLVGNGTVSAADLADAYRDAIDDALVPVAGAEALVTSLKERYRVGLLTDGPVRAQQQKLDALGWTGLFDAVVITGSLAAGKPDVRAFEAITESLSASAEETVYVGDHPEIDVAGARAAGLHPIQVIDGEPTRGTNTTVERDALADELSSLIEAIE